jgi:nicotinate-nucleotide pyrophosphorylase (carboxylating)
VTNAEEAMPQQLPSIDPSRMRTLVRLALDEDLGDHGDVTTDSVIPAEMAAAAVLVAREDCVCAGLAVAEAVFRAVDPDVVFRANVHDGDHCPAGTVLADAAGPARALLTAERTALNFLQRLCGIATISATAVRAAGKKLRVLDTRKTTPGWRNLEKYAVACGGAENHRVGLHDRVLIKDNHRDLAGLAGPGGIGRAVAAARAAHPDLLIEVEADTLAEVAEALAAKADWILLDNMTDADMAAAVHLVAGRARLEASGGITLPRLPAIARTGVDAVSLGALTHSARAVDIAMDIRPQPQPATGWIPCP